MPIPWNGARTLQITSLWRYTRLATHRTEGKFSIMSDISLQVTLQFSEELLCRPPEQRNDEDVQKVLSWVRHKSSLFKNLEDGKWWDLNGYRGLTYQCAKKANSCKVAWASDDSRQTIEGIILITSTAAQSKLSLHNIIDKLTLSRNRNELRRGTSELWSCDIPRVMMASFRTVCFQNVYVKENKFWRKCVTVRWSVAFSQYWK